MRKRLILTTCATTLSAIACTSSIKNDSERQAADTSKIERLRAPDRVINYPQLEVPFENGSAQRCVFTMNEIDAYAMLSTRKDTVISMDGEGLTPVTVWYDKTSTPIKIAYALKGESNQISGVFSFYFINGKLWLADWLYAKYVFNEDEELVYWLGETWAISETRDSANFDDRQQHVREHLTLILKKLALE